MIVSAISLVERNSGGGRRATISDCGHPHPNRPVRSPSLRNRRRMRGRSCRDRPRHGGEMPARMARREGFEFEEGILTVFKRFEVVWPFASVSAVRDNML